MFEKVTDAAFVSGEHDVLRFWTEEQIFPKLIEKNRGNEPWSFLDGPITANNPMGVHHAWGRTLKDVYQRFHAMCGKDQRYQNGFDCQGLWVEVEVEKELNLGTKTAIEEYGIDKFVNECKRRVLRFAARQTEQSIRLGYWMDWDRPDELRKLADGLGSDEPIEYQSASGESATDSAHRIVSRLGVEPGWGGSYFTFSTENNETIWAFLKKCFDRGKIYRGHDVMPWSGRAGSAYSQMEVADGRKLVTHKSVFVRFPLLDRDNEYLLVWTTTPWTLTSNVAAAVNPDLEYVKLRAKKDGAVYYFAKDNLEYQRLAHQWKDGFDGQKWPEGVPKLKTIAQIFKEQGGYEVEETLKGSEMVGWTYSGPFDDLDAQQTAFAEHKSAIRDLQSAIIHRVIDGGRDSKGNPNVVAGEGTGIVHIAPGCGDIDHKIGMELGLPIIAPLNAEGRFLDEFGEFTGREAIDKAVPEMVFEELKKKEMLVYVETYPHIYPHCWRTGDELVFRLVDEWFINMDWRDEIKQVVKQITWLPDEIKGEERELEWLTIMRDWMISKKRFWGLALPIWVDEENPEDFEVMGSLAELKERAVEGWEQVEQHTPHRPWIDAVKIKSTKTGNLLSRIPDVGNPWLDAGIVPYSTVRYNFDKDFWTKWCPAELVTECFPGQFRNWFYSLLTMSTMMEQRRPFKTLLGHRLVMDEQGNAMHKSDGTAIWFEEAAEQLGVDTLRWMYLSQNPSHDLRFGTRHPDEPVTLQTMEGTIAETREGLPTCKVTSTPADEVRRQVLIPLWNSYKFFVNFAVLDEYDPNTEGIPVADRPEIDRWILSNLQALIATCRENYEAFNVLEVTRAAAAFIDDLSNWYIRRNRRRFWAKRDDGDESDKLAAYNTLHEVLLALCQVLAPCIPFLTERMYRNLSRGEPMPDSVHLCTFPTVDDELLDEALNARMATAQVVVRLGHRLREENKIRVRQPLAELRFAGDAGSCASIEQLADVIAEELNVKRLTRAENLDELVSYSYKPNLRTLGPRHGKLLGAIRKELPELGDAVLSPLRRGETVTVTIAGEQIELAADDVMVSTEQAADWIAGDDAGIQIALSTQMSEDLLQEGMARDFIRHVQSLRKDHDLEENDRIEITYSSESEDIRAAISKWQTEICKETRADAVNLTESELDGNTVTVGEGKVVIRIDSTSR